MVRLRSSLALACLALLLSTGCGRKTRVHYQSLSGVPSRGRIEAKKQDIDTVLVTYLRNSSKFRQASGTLKDLRVFSQGSATSSSLIGAGARSEIRTYYFEGELASGLVTLEAEYKGRGWLIRETAVDFFDMKPTGLPLADIVIPEQGSDARPAIVPQGVTN